MTKAHSASMEKDQYILELFQTAPKEAFRLLFDTYHLKLCLFVVRFTDSFEMAEDIVQDFFVYFWEKKSYRQIKHNLRRYLYTSVRNASIAALQKHNLLSMETLSGIDMQHFMEDIEKGEEEEQKEEHFRLLPGKLEKLTPQERLVVTAVILENKKYKEAAGELNISINTLKTLLSRALKRLRKEYNLFSLFL
ncbi:sigma-70 family RNA polymerase sigma factor [Porphyromonas macacae]|nr:sigma-70 family RNA polymerase sigma factor [Porphyromonas macacae]